MPNLLLLGVHKLDAIIISHPDSDHVNGYPDVLEALPVGMLLDPEIPDDLSAVPASTGSGQAEGNPALSRARRRAC